MKIKFEEIVGGEFCTLAMLLCSAMDRVYGSHVEDIKSGSPAADCSVGRKVRDEVRSLVEQMAEQAPGDWPGCLLGNLRVWNERVADALAAEADADRKAEAEQASSVELWCANCIEWFVVDPQVVSPRDLVECPQCGGAFGDARQGKESA